MRWGGKWERLDDGIHNQANLEIWDVTPDGFQFKIIAFSGAHTGEIKGGSILNQGDATFKDTESDCEVHFLLKGKIIEIETINNCHGYGGMGVGFSGKYQKVEMHNFFEDEEREYAFYRLVNKYYDLFVESKHISYDQDDIDSFGANVKSFSVRGLSTVLESIIMISPDGRMWAAVIDEEEVRYFANDPSYKKKLPKTIEEWRKAFSDKRVIFPGQE